MVLFSFTLNAPSHGSVSGSGDLSMHVSLPVTVARSSTDDSATLDYVLPVL